MNSKNNEEPTVEILILGIGNLLMGDEGIGVRIVEEIKKEQLPEGVECLDGGTGSFQLLAPMTAARKIVLIDATIDGAPAGTVRRLTPRYSRDYPRTLTAHDIGLKDMLDAFYLLGAQPEVVLYAISIPPLGEIGLELTPAVAAAIPDVVDAIVAEVEAEK